MIVQDTQENLKSFIGSTFGWNGPGASERWDLYATYGTAEEMKLLRQALDEARGFIRHATSEGFDADDCVRKATTLLDAAERAFEPVNARIGLVKGLEDAAWWFAAWLDDCLAFVCRDPGSYSARHCELKARLEDFKSRYDKIAWKRSMQSSRPRWNLVKLAERPPFTADMLDEHRRQLEVDIISVCGSCPPLRA
jgi:hypothetical protein